VSSILSFVAAVVSTTLAQDPAQRDSPPAEIVGQGKAIYEGKGGALCMTCHGRDAKGVTGLGPDLTDPSWLHGDGSLEFLRELIKAGVIQPKKSASIMPPMGGAALTVQQLYAVAAYVYTLRIDK
jgi:mono/diheme cytochrome c family protein